MKASEFRKLIREEVRKVLAEATIDTSLLNKLKVALAARISNPDDENAHDEVQDLLVQIYTKAGRKDAEELAAGNMEDEVTASGPLSAVVSLVKDTMSVPKPSSKGIAILSSFGDNTMAIVKKTPSGSEISTVDYLPNQDSDLYWKYSYAGSPAELLKSLIASNTIEQQGSKFFMVDRKSNMASLVKGIKSDSKFKKIK